MHESPSAFAHLEFPAPGGGLAPGRRTLRGWLVPKSGHHFADLRARLDGREFPGVLGFPRADLAAHFQAGRPWLPAEFTVDLDLDPGTASLRLEALDLSGRWQEVLATTLAVQGDPAPPAPARDDPATAADFARAVRLGFQRGEVILPLWPRLLRVGHPPFQGYLADPAAIAPGLYGRMEVLGWLFHDTQPVRRVFATTDLLTLQPLAYGGEFAGVRARYPGHPFAGDCHFKGMVDFPGNLPPPATLRIFAELADGGIHLVLASRCRPVATEELKLAWPTFAPLSFWRHWRATSRAAARHRLPVETGAARRREFWRALREYRTLAASGSSSDPARLPPAPAAGRSLRLLLITHNLNREGAPLLFAEYAGYLARQPGAEITVLAGRDGPLRAAFAATGATVVIADADPAAAASPAALQALLRSLAPRLPWNRIDAVVANTVLAFWGVPLAAHARRPSLLYIHESNRPAVFFARTTPALLPAVHAALRTATAVSFNTPATQAYYAGLGSGGNFHLNPAWIDRAALDAFRAAHPRAGLRAQLGLHEGGQLVVNLGTVCERKGQHDFLRAVEWLARLDPPLATRGRFVMVGGRETPYDREVRARLAVLGRPNLEVVPESPRPFDWLAAADLFVCTSYEESFPRVVLEAMAFGIPIVSTNVHGLPYMLRAGEEALLTAPGDIAGLAGAMRHLLANPDTARAQADRARQRVAEFDAAALLPRHAAFTAAVAGLSA